MKEGWKLIVGKAEHIRSHQLEGPNAINIDSVDPDTKHRLLGNQLADEAAGEGHAMHPELNAELLQLDRLAYRAAQQVVHLAARVLPLHPKRAQHLRRPRQDPPITTPSDEENGPGDRQEQENNDEQLEPAQRPTHHASFEHDWCEGEPGRWRCRSCALVANTGRPAPPPKSGCRGVPVALSRVGSGHRLVIYHPTSTNPDPTPLFACELCHAAGTSRPIFFGYVPLHADPGQEPGIQAAGARHAPSPSEG